MELYFVIINNYIFLGQLASWLGTVIIQLTSANKQSLAKAMMILTNQWWDKTAGLELISPFSKGRP
jgi:hypothetical protein